MGAVYGYYRVSTAAQASEGESLGVQRRQLEGWAHMQGQRLDAVFVERGVSGSVPLTERPEGGRLWARLHPGDVLVAPKFDRLFRSAQPSPPERLSSVSPPSASAPTTPPARPRPRSR